MDCIKVNFENLTSSEREQLLKLVKKVNMSVKLADVEVGKIFKVGDIEFIKFCDVNGGTFAVTKDSLYDSKFGENNNFSTSKVFDKLNTEFVSKIENVIGVDNILEFETDLLSLDGLDTHGKNDFEN